MKRGEIWLGSLNPTRGMEVGKTRPLLIFQADFLTDLGEPTVIVLPLTTQIRASKEPLHVTIVARGELRQTSRVMPEMPRSVDRRRLSKGPLTRLTAAEMGAVERSFLAVTGLDR